MNKRKIGAEYEKKAVQYLRINGLSILELNYRNRKGEIDIICKDEDYYVFVEVKYRKDNEKGAPAEAVTYSKRKNICLVADYYRMIHRIGEFTPVRYDVISICGEEITWYKNAFEHIYSY